MAKMVDSFKRKLDRVFDDNLRTKASRISENAEKLTNALNNKMGDLKDAYSSSKKEVMDVVEQAQEYIDDLQDTEQFQNIKEQSQKVLDVTSKSAKIAGRYSLKAGKVVSGVQAVENVKRTKALKEETAALQEYLQKRNREVEAQMDSALQEFGRVRLTVLHDTVGAFLKFTDAIGKKSKDKEYEILMDVDLPQKQFEDMRILSINAGDVIKTASASIACGAAAVAGVPAAVTAFAAASTGTAISSLSGAAASNAVLAWLGGGSIAAGGAGVAGGTIVLGSLTAGAAVISAGLIASVITSKKLTEAERINSDTKTQKATMELAWELSSQIMNRADELQQCTISLSQKAIEAMNKLSPLVLCFDYNNDEHVKLFQEAALLVKSISELVQVPLLDKEGNLTEQSGLVLSKTEKILNKNL